MSDHDETYQRVSVPEAASILGISVATVRRRIRDGSLRAERIERPQGVAYMVLLPSDQATDHERSNSDQQVGTTARLNRSEQPAAEAIAAMIQATLTPIIGPLVAELSASRQANERQAQEIGDLREERGRLASELEAAAGEQIAAKVRETRLRGELEAKETQTVELQRETARLTAELDAERTALAARPVVAQPEPLPPDLTADTRNRLSRHEWLTLIAVTAGLGLLVIVGVVTLAMAGWQWYEANASSITASQPVAWSWLVRATVVVTVVVIPAAILGAFCTYAQELPGRPEGWERPCFEWSARIYLVGRWPMVLGWVIIFLWAFGEPLAVGAWQFLAGLWAQLP